MKFSFILFFCLYIFNFSYGYGSNNNEHLHDKSSFTEDAITSFGYLLRGSYLQFTQPANLIYAGVAAPALWYSFEHDKRLVALASTKEVPKHVKLVADFGVVFNFPILPISTYVYGRIKQDRKICNVKNSLRT